MISLKFQPKKKKKSSIYYKKFILKHQVDKASRPHSSF